ncbi:unnamed protein product [Soboliphyme baturini]|uniref:Secreted protein n=1 Tax=Soboliphyme baturini TaxID=241478 RepID=A0A183J158_9BILA|nr:unnamed protein product [Soboliphyme baturini]
MGILRRVAGLTRLGMSGIVISRRALVYSVCFSRLRSRSCDGWGMCCECVQKGRLSNCSLHIRPSKVQGTAKMNLVQIYERSLFQTPFVFCRSSDSGTGSGTLEALSDASASFCRSSDSGTGSGTLEALSDASASADPKRRSGDGR